MDIKTVCQVLQPIRELEMELDCNVWFQQELAKLIQATGKTAKELTIGKLLELCKKAEAAIAEGQA